MFKNIGHFFASIAHAAVTAAHDVKSGLTKAEAEMPAIAAVVAKSEPLVEGVTSVLAPNAVAIERAAYHIFGNAAAAVTAAGDAAAANGVNLTLDQNAIAAIKAALAGLAGKKVGG